MDLRRIFYMRDGNVTKTDGILKLHPTTETHWVLCTNEHYFDPQGCPLTNLLSEFIFEGNGKKFFQRKENKKK